MDEQNAEQMYIEYHKSVIADIRDRKQFSDESANRDRIRLVLQLVEVFSLLLIAIKILSA